jgi:hypothetical protein
MLREGRRLEQTFKSTFRQHLKPVFSICFWSRHLHCTERSAVQVYGGEWCANSLELAYNRRLLDQRMLLNKVSGE